jgi:hypothetical protein
LADKLTHPENREKVVNFMKGKCIRTLYPNRAGETKVFPFGGITHNPARIEKAYEGFLNVTVQQHMYATRLNYVPTNQHQFRYCRHRIRLLYPLNPCVIELCKSGLHKRYYPMELVEIVSENEIKKEEEEDNSSNNTSQLSTYTEIENEYMFNHPRLYSQVYF